MATAKNLSECAADCYNEINQIVAFGYLDGADPIVPDKVAAMLLQRINRALLLLDEIWTAEVENAITAVGRDDRMNGIALPAWGDDTYPSWHHLVRHTCERLRSHLFDALNTHSGKFAGSIGTNELPATGDFWRWLESLLADDGIESMFNGEKPAGVLVNMSESWMGAKLRGAVPTITTMETNLRLEAQRIALAPSHPLFVPGSMHWLDSAESAPRLGKNVKQLRDARKRCKQTWTGLDGSRYGQSDATGLFKFEDKTIGPMHYMPSPPVRERKKSKKS